MSEKNKTKSAEVDNTEEEEEYPLVYNLWIENFTLNMAEGCVVNISSGRPKDPKPGGGG